MTIDEIRERVAAIEAVAGDPEAAHGREDDLREDFIRYLGTNFDLPPEIREMAALVASTSSLDFPRWCA